MSNRAGVFSQERLARTSFYPREYLANRSRYTPLRSETQFSYTDQNAIKNTFGPLQGGELVQSNRAMMLSPYKDRDIEVFGPYDDYYGSWQEIKNSNTCALIPDVAVVNHEVTLDHFKNWEIFGYVHIATHGDNYFRGLRTAWLEVWGPSEFLSGGLSLVGVDTGMVFSRTFSDDVQFEDYEDELQSKRVAIGPGGTIIVLPSFFKRYLGNLPNSIVVVSSCRSGYNNSLFNVLLSKGAGAVVGFDNYVNTLYAHNTTKEITRTLLTGATIGEAVQSAVVAYGAEGPSKYKARLVSRGKSDRKLGSGQLSNGGFETGSIAPWEKQGDGRIITKLGRHQPTSGYYMGIISTGLGFTTTTGSITQSVCFAPSQSWLSFDWNFLSEEFLEYCNSSFDDAFHVEVCRGTNCNRVFEASVNDLCENPNVLTKESIGFDRGDVYGTGWRNQRINVSEYSDGGAELRFFSTDVGDSVYDTAILLDEINVE